MDSYDPSDDRSFLAPALAAGVSSMGLMFAMSTRKDGTRFLDDIADMATYMGDSSPLGLMHTFRIREFASPFTSSAYQMRQINKQNVPGVSASMADDTLSVRYDSSFFQNKESISFLSDVTGMSTEELREKGIHSTSSAQEFDLLFQRKKNGIGSLTAVPRQGVDKKSVLLSSNVNLMEYSDTSSELLDYGKSAPINPAAKGYLQATGQYRHDGDHKVGRIFKRKIEAHADAVGDKAVHAYAPYLPVAAIRGDVDDAAGLMRRTGLIRGVAAASVERFNRLIDQTVNLIPSPKLQEMVRATGIDRVKEGPAIRQYLMGYGKRALKLGGIGLGVSTLSDFRDDFGGLGNIPISGIVSAGLGMAFKKFNFSNKTSFGVAAASFFGQVLTPGMSNGLISGFAGAYSSLDTLRGNTLNPFNYYRRTMEGLLPGVSTVEMGAFSAVAAVTLGASQFRGKTLLQHGLEKIGFASEDYVRPLRSIVEDKFKEKAEGKFKFGMRHLFTDDEDLSYDRVRDYVRTRNDAMRSARVQREADYADLPAAKKYESRLDQIASEYHQSDSPFRRVKLEARGLFEDVRASIMGLDPKSHVAHDEFKLRGRLGALGTLGVAAFVGHQVLTGGLLGSMESSEELRDIYSGDQLVEVKSGRWWLFGSREFGGDEANVKLRHSRIAQIMNGTDDAWEWGNRQDSLAITKFFLKNFTYQQEEELMYRDPSLASASAFENIPIVGGLLATTIGRVVKPEKYIRENEWNDPDFPSYSALGDPISANSFGTRAANMYQQFTDMIGMWGWAANTISKTTIGDQNFESRRPHLDTIGYRTSMTASFWESEIGDPGTTEAVRRVLMRRSSEYETFNPLANDQPSWMPMKLRMGSPTAKAGGLARSLLPGPSMENIYPELAGVHPEDYPMIYRMRVLSALAPETREFRETQKAVYEMAKNGAYKEEELKQIEQMSQDAGRILRGYVNEKVNPRAIEVPLISSLTQAAWQTGWAAARSAAAPAEYLVPFGFRPFQKFTGFMRDPIEQYKYENVYGSPTGDWQAPWNDWFRPAFLTAGSLLPGEFTPSYRKKIHDTNEYFDKLEFYKYASLALEAEKMGGNANDLYRRAAETRYGINPYGSTMGVYWSLPIEQRKYMHSFLEASERERSQILKILPEDHKHLYRAMWQRLDSGEDMELFGGSRSQDVDPRYIRQRFYELLNYFEENPLPPPDFIGWDQGVKMDDIRVLFINEEASNMHNYNVWEKQVRYARAEPMAVMAAQQLSAITAGDAYRAASRTGMDISVTPTGGKTGSVNLELGDTREDGITSALQGFL